MSTGQGLCAYYGKAERKASYVAMAVARPPGQGVLDEDKQGTWEEETGIPLAIGLLGNFFYKHLHTQYSLDWPEEFYEAIPVGADLSPVVPRLLCRSILSLLEYVDKPTLPAINRVIDEVLVPRANGKAVPEDVAAAAAEAARKAGRAAFTKAQWAVVSAAEAAVMAPSSAVAAVQAMEAVFAAEDVVYSRKPGLSLSGQRSAWQWSRKLLELMMEAPIVEPAEEELSISAEEELKVTVPTLPVTEGWSVTVPSEPGVEWKEVMQLSDGLKGVEVSDVLKGVEAKLIAAQEQSQEAIKEALAVREDLCKALGSIDAHLAKLGYKMTPVQGVTVPGSARYIWVQEMPYSPQSPEVNIDLSDKGKEGQWQVVYADRPS